ncbi:sigma-70 family RNA polymerase sigma factor [Paenibacillus piri]|uniref:Sigma-70 family RNA polymerase sigma factor n=1 Tax=Paenibacillus piri TaxID=2547395 RepID=A0A4R5K9L1_9BACL|nr:sigma-70 family RNA polymerase sigma factor [Paenibacillus piri]TDF91861.1 sigma-70 family RNA polymerase sigma factor [Paenibacillus piri]
MSEALSGHYQDQELIAQIAVRNEEAFKKLYDRYEKPVYVFIYRIVRDAAKAEEILQQMFGQLWNAADGFDGQEGEPAKRIFALARKLAVDVLRIRRTRASRHVADSGQESRQSLPLQLTDGALETAATSEREWIGERVNSALERLSREQRQIVEWIYFQGYTPQEIADRHSIPLKTVKSRGRIAVKQLRQHLSDLAGGVSAISSGQSDTMCERVELYALDGLEEHEKVAFAYHLTQCALCRNQLKELQRMVELLPAASDAVPLPAGIRSRLLSAVLGEAAAGRAGAASEALPSGGRRAGQATGRTSRYVSSRDLAAFAAEAQGKPAADAAELSRRAVRKERAGRQAVYWRLASAALLIAGAAAGWYGYQSKQLANQLQTELAASNNAQLKMGADLDKAAAELLSLHRPAEALKVSRTASLTPMLDTIASKGQATIGVDSKGMHLLVQVEDMPIIKQEEAFQVWLIKNNAPTNAGTFFSQNGRGASYFTFEPKEFDSLSITIEPDAKGEKPRGPVIMSASLKD